MNIFSHKNMERVSRTCTYMSPAYDFEYQDLGCVVFIRLKQWLNICILSKWLRNVTLQYTKLKIVSINTSSPCNHQSITLPYQICAISDHDSLLPLPFPSSKFVFNHYNYEEALDCIESILRNIYYELTIILITDRQYRQPSCIKKEHCVCETAALRNTVVKWKGSRSNALGIVGVNVRRTKPVGDEGRTIFSRHRASIMQYVWVSDMWLSVWQTGNVITFSPLWSW
jgi:hypothetical protein